MSRPLDTPSRAARAERPQTRHWKQLLAAASSEATSAAAIRTQLRAHLEAADRLAARRTSPAPTPPALHALHSVDADWNQRVAALAALRAQPAAVAPSLAARLLAVQLADLRSRVVVEAADAVAAVARARRFDAALAGDVFEAAAGGAHVAKNVMAEARRRAGLAALCGQEDAALFGRVAEVAGNAPHPAARKLAVDALAEAVEAAPRVDAVVGAAEAALGKAATDRTVEVRAAARRLAREFENKFGEEAWGRLVEALPKEAAGRLEGEVVHKEAGDVGPGKEKKERPTMKEVIRMKRLAAKKAKEMANEANRGADGEDGEGRETDEVRRKRMTSDTPLSDRKEGAKKGACPVEGKENVANAST